MDNVLVLSVGEIVGITTIIISIVTALILDRTNTKDRLKALEIRVTQNEKNVQTVETALETIRKENRQDHKLMFDKLDKALSK